jgi:hypothetical protein
MRHPRKGYLTPFPHDTLSASQDYQLGQQRGSTCFPDKGAYGKLERTARIGGAPGRQRESC